MTQYIVSVRTYGGSEFLQVKFSSLRKARSYAWDSIRKMKYDIRSKTGTRDYCSLRIRIYRWSDSQLIKEYV